MNLLFLIFFAVVAVYVLCFALAVVVSLLLIRHKLREHQEKLRFG
jgi:hypothetical protein